jgi:hypothetical protein
MYLQTYLTGLDNSEVFAEDGILIHEVKESYERYIANHHGTDSARLLDEYFKVIKQNGYKKSPEVEKFLSRHKLHSMQGKESPLR